ncbi:hypothetical protein RJ641_006422 [Dillenia turbinata]|uniref:Uncharacterized protein n=1 Tax=Dillenia turbinata TaxID=194707 RepID=A0AAN8VD65_9MAGN
MSLTGTSGTNDTSASVPVTYAFSGSPAITLEKLYKKKYLAWSASVELWLLHQGADYQEYLQLKAAKQAQSSTVTVAQTDYSTLHELLTKPSVSRIPLLFLGNKIDKSEALSKRRVGGPANQSLIERLASQALNSSKMIQSPDVGVLFGHLLSERSIYEIRHKYKPKALKFFRHATSNRRNISQEKVFAVSEQLQALLKCVLIQGQSIFAEISESSLQLISAVRIQTTMFEAAGLMAKPSVLREFD